MDSSEIKALGELESIHWWYQIRKSILTKNVLKMGKLEHILDLGSATGGNTLALQELGYKVTSVEYSDTGVQIQVSKGISVIQADARSLPFSEDSFDLVICLDVIEHIFEEQAVVKEIARVLKDRGKFIFTVPEGKKLWSSHDVAVSHVKRYEKKEFSELIQSAGLRVDILQSRNVFLKPIAIVLRKIKTGSDLKRVPWLLNKILFCTAYVENKIGTGRFKGMTIWAIGEKSDF